ncbi:bifunctional NAD(P)/FAD-dependent oxidoreductase/class I SAM-dependent methyltransferase [Microlunatus endophyticus]|nr:bifunctional NAD(P)/FAD-dependent oxidoreductase/class I SAM-dependent methyltransferase [Microlunatus endophyticus]
MAEHASHDHTADDHTAHDHTDPGARVIQRHCDVAVIGGSAAGLAAALQLARQRRTVIAVDDGTPRNAPAEHMHGYLGREGIAPSDLVAIGREEVRSYGGEILTGRALAVRKHDDGFLVELTGGHSLVARRVLAATGVADELPDIDGLAPRWGKDVVNCPFCHGFEVRDQRLVQIVTHPMALHPTPLFRQLTDRLTVVVHQPQGVDDAAVARLVEAGVPVIRERVVRIVSGPDASVAGVELADGRVLEADAVVAGSRFHGRADAFAPAGVTTTPHPTGMGDVVEVDAAGQTAVPGIYAAGNLTDPSLQVLPSAAHGSRVGAMIAFSLADEDLRAGVRPSGAEADWDHRYSDEDRMWSANPNGTLTREVTGLTPGRALDVGAGEGADALWLSEHGWQVTASDISGNALARVRAEADRRGLSVDRLRRDANDREAFPSGGFDLVSLQYGSFQRTPDQRGLHNLLGAVAPGGTLLVVSHDLAPLAEPVDVATQTRMFDPGAYVGIEEIVAAIGEAGDWTIEVHDTRDRPPGAASTHHVRDVLLRAVKSNRSPLA